jgi:hypothetical protein
MYDVAERATKDLETLGDTADSSAVFNIYLYAIRDSSVTIILEK